MVDVNLTMTYSNPRLYATIENWPASAKQRVTAVFKVEATPGKGERMTRTTTGATKRLIYATRVRLVDGSDGRTYVIALHPSGMISVMRVDMKYQHEVLFPDKYPRYSDVYKLLFAE